MKQKIQILCFFLCCLFFACGLEAPETEMAPNIQESQFVDLLVDVHLLEAALRMSEIKRTNSIKYPGNDLYQKIYEKHGIKREDFLQTVEYYTFYPEKLKEIYKEVGEKIEKLK